MKSNHQVFVFNGNEFSSITGDKEFRNKILGFLKLKTTQIALMFMERLRQKGYLDNEMNMVVKINQCGGHIDVYYKGNGHPPREPELFDPPLDGVRN